jgi:hypothetical protein
MWTRLGLVLALAALTVAGCRTTVDPGVPVPGGAYVIDARTDPAVMRAVPDVVSPGGEIEAVFPRGSTRGPGFVLERHTDEGWAWRFAISSETDVPDRVNVFTAEEFVARNVEWTAGPAFDGTDPHLIPVPHGVEPGLWRVCTVPDTPGLCAEFDVIADEQ